MKGARLFGKFICKAIISMGIKNPTYFLVAVLQIEFCDEQTSQLIAAVPGGSSVGRVSDWIFIQGALA